MGNGCEVKVRETRGPGGEISEYKIQIHTYEKSQLENTEKIRRKKVRVGNGCEVKVRETRGTGGERDP